MLEFPIQIIVNSRKIEYEEARQIPLHSDDWKHMKVIFNNQPSVMTRYVVNPTETTVD